MKLKLRVTILFIVLQLVIVCATFAQKNENSDNWDNYPVWVNTTSYTKTYVVDQKNPDASDNNEGTYEKPLLTINKAAKLVKAGERVLIYGGIYRELIQPHDGGLSADKMISYESAPGEQVIVKGSRILKCKWGQRGVLTDVLPDSSLTYSWSRRIWQTNIPNEFFESNYYPFQLPNILPEEYKLMPWAGLVKELAPFNLTRGLIFQNGLRMKQLESYGDLARIEGSFWVDKNGKTIHIHPFGGGNPNKDIFEIGVQSHLLKPSKIGLGYIQIRSITFEHCANGFLRTSTGALTALGGHHWIFENNIIRQINSSGLEFGFNAYEFEDPRSENIQPRKDIDLGGMFVRNNQIYDCGTAGIRSYSVKNGIIINNTIWNCGWQDAENYWEVAGIKILCSRNNLVKGNHIYKIQGGNGIWLDWDNQHSRVTANVIHDIQTIQGGVFVEASQTANLIDNNFIWNIDGNGIYGNDTDELLIYHNLIANTTGALVCAVVATKRELNRRWLTATNNKIANNIFINGGLSIIFEAKNNFADNNLYVTTHEPEQIDFAKWQLCGADKNSKSIRAYAGFDLLNQSFSWRSNENLPVFPGIESISVDFFGKKRVGNSTLPGPFINLNKTTQVFLN